MKVALIFLLALLVSLSCRASPGIQAGAAADAPWIAGQARNEPVVQEARLDQHPGAALPLAATLRDASGRTVRLADVFNGRTPVLLVPGYFHCEQLCGLLMHGLLESLQQGGVPRSDWRIVRVSVAGDDTPADAALQRELDLAYAEFLQRGSTPAAPLQLDLLLADAPAARAIGDAIGWSWRPLAPAKDAGGTRTQYAHPTTVVVLTPQGRVSRYLNGVRFDAQDVRAALVEASAGRVGSVSDQLALLCAHLVEGFGQHTQAVMNGMRAVALLVLFALGAFAWRHRGEVT
jgi:protein SCO1